MSTESDLIALANRVRDFVDQEIPNVTAWNINPDVLDQALRLIGPSFTVLETGLADTNERLDTITLPDGSLIAVGEWVGEPAAETYLDTQTFSLLGNQTAYYRQGSRIRATLTAPTKVIGTATAVNFNAGQNQTIINLSAAVLTPALSAIERSIIYESAPQVRTQDLIDQAVTEPKLADNAVSTRALVAACVTAAKMAVNSVLTAAIADGAVLNAKVGWKSLKGSERLADGSLDGSVTITDRSITAAKIVSDSITSNEIKNRTIVGGDIAQRAVYYDNIAVGHVRGSWSGGQNEIGQKTIWGDADLADLSVSNRVIANKVIWINDKCADKSMLGYNSIVDGSVAIAQLADGAATKQGVAAGTVNGQLVNPGSWLEVGAVQFNLTRPGWVMIFTDVPGWVIAGGQESHFYAELRQNGSFLTQRHWMNQGAGATTHTVALMAIGWWGGGNYRLSIHLYSSVSAYYVWSGVIQAIQFT